MNNRFKQTEIGEIPEEWEVKLLGSSLKLLKDGSHNPPKRVSTGIKFIAGASDMKYRKIDFSKCSFITEEDYKKIHKYYEIKEHDVLLTIVGTVGNTAIVEKHDLPFSMQRSIALLRPGENLHHQFLFYWLNSSIFKFQISSRINPTGQPGIYLGEIGKLPHPSPPFSEQHSIAKILSDLDSQIENLQSQNATLEAIGKVLFKHWFVDFEFADEHGQPYKSNGGKMQETELGDVPEGWGVDDIDSISHHEKASVSPLEYPEDSFFHYSIPAFDSNKQPEIVKGNQILSNKYIVQKGSILFSKLNPRFPRIWFVNEPENLSVCSTEFIQLIANENWRTYIYFMLQTDVILSQLQSYAKGTSSSHQRINPKDLLKLEFPKPKNQVVTKFSELTEPLLSRIYLNGLTALNLVELRDSLLPKLMSGKIRVGEIA